MTKADLITKITQRSPLLTKKDANLLINTIFDAMSAALAQGERIEIRGFASFGVKTRNAREGRNPKTGAVAQVPERKVVTFKAGKGMMERLNGDAEEGMADE